MIKHGVSCVSKTRFLPRWSIASLVGPEGVLCSGTVIGVGHHGEYVNRQFLISTQSRSTVFKIRLSQAFNLFKGPTFSSFFHL